MGRSIKSLSFAPTRADKSPTNVQRNPSPKLLDHDSNVNSIVPISSFIGSAGIIAARASLPEQFQRSAATDAPGLGARIKYPPPNVAKLAEPQREPFRSIIAALEASNFDLKAVHEKIPALIAQMKSICETDDYQDCMSRQLEDWVRWQRLRGYYLALIA